MYRSYTLKIQHTVIIASHNILGIAHCKLKISHDTHRYGRQWERLASSNQILIMQHISKFFPSRENNVILPVACLTVCSRADRNTFEDCRGMFVSMCVGARQRERQICHFFISVVWWGWQRMRRICLTVPPWQTYADLYKQHIGAVFCSLTSVTHNTSITLQLLICIPFPVHPSTVAALSVCPFSHPFSITPFVHLQTGPAVYVCITTSGS